MAKKLVMGVAPALVVVALVLAPAGAQASPKFYVNGKLAEKSHEPIVNYGAITLENKFLGKIKCQNLASGYIWNESEKGLGDTEGYTTYACSSEPTPCTGVFATAEQPVEVTEKLIASEKRHVAVRGKSDLPWSGEVIQEASGEKLKKIKTNGIKVTIVMPCDNLEFPFEGALEPISVNGSKSGLSPSHLVFQGKGGKTGFLITNSLKGPEEEKIGYTSGEVTTVGGNVELITAE
jgi:hypothetical protein